MTRRLSPSLLAATAKPVRIQRSRRKGSRLPPNTVCVTRPGAWGNPYRIGDLVRTDGFGNPMAGGKFVVKVRDARHAVDLFRNAVESGEWFDHLARNFHHNGLVPDSWDIGVVRRMLRGMNLACWCAPDQPCHADVLLELANAAPRVPEPKGQKGEA